MSGACPACSAPLSEGQRFCGRCGTDTGAAPGTAGATRTSAPSAPLDSSEIAARFSPGTVIAGRYRIVGLLGRGGMGEVYRADDLKLARPVALKFLPEQVERDPSRLNRLLNEVRTALSVSHPNVCRVHDVHQEAGRHFITMEFVDGDDLASLLRRIGRLPPDKALEISRQLCAGLGAAHSAGVLHRDLKPANIMIDGRGQVKITDFGLAGLAGGFEGAEVTAGTPAYMAPEQLSGKGVTEASDLYSLGLVLYEIYTGKPAHEGGSPAEIARRRLSSAPTSPSSHITDIDPAVERVILRCLEREPADRPPSALAVSAALPGGDPLAAALAAGETPAPELVAEAGAVGGLSHAKAWALLAAFLVFIALSIAGVERYNPISRADLPRSVAVLREDARRILTSLGYGETPDVDSVVDFELHWAYLRHVGDEVKPDPMAPAADRQPAGIRFGYRQRPDWLQLASGGSVGSWISRSYPTTPGEIRLQLDPIGRLIWLDVVPPERPESRSRTETDWNALLTAAGFEVTALTETEPEWTSPRGFDERRAWEGVYPEAPEVPIRIEASAVAGRPVTFRIVEPWTEPRETASPPQFGLGPVLGPAINLLTLLAAAFLAWRNVRLGRGDRRTALRFALAIGGIRMMWYVFTHHTPAPQETFYLTAHLAWSLFRFGRAYIVYLAVEPYARKLWPRMLTSWVRLFDGRFRDPLVGRDVLIGLTIAGGFSLFGALTTFARERFDLTLLDMLNQSGPSNFGWSTEALRGLPGALLGFFGVITSQVDVVFFIAIIVLVSRLVLRRDALALLPILALILVFSLQDGPGGAVSGLLLFVATWLSLFRVGLLAFVVFSVSSSFFRESPLTYDLTAWWAAPSWIALASLILLAGWSFRVALAGQPIFRDRILEG